MKFSIKNEEIQSVNGSYVPEFPKYTSQLINLANQNAQATRPKNVGQLSELFPEFKNESDDVTIDKWHQWYEEKYTNAIDEAADRIYAQLENLRGAIDLIDQSMVKEWGEDLVITKTFNGLYVQEAILANLAERENSTYRMAVPEEEAKGIDGYVGNKAYSVKPDTYKSMSRLSEAIDVTMIYYTKTKNGLKVEVEE